MKTRNYYDIPYEECDELWLEFHNQVPINCILLRPNEQPKLIETYNDEEAWSSLVGTDYHIYYLYDCLAVVVNEDEDDQLEPTAIIRLPREGIIIEVSGTLIVTGYYEGEAEGYIPVTGQPFLTSISPYAFRQMDRYIFDTSLDVLL